jgi:hypothetical protein
MTRPRPLGIINNDISGIGYTNTCNVGGTPETCAIDTTSSQATKVHANAVGRAAPHNRRALIGALRIDGCEATSVSRID